MKLTAVVFLMRYRHLRIAHIKELEAQERWVEVGAIQDELHPLGCAIDDLERVENEASQSSNEF